MGSEVCRRIVCRRHGPGLVQNVGQRHPGIVQGSDDNIQRVDGLTVADGLQQFADGRLGLGDGIFAHSGGGSVSQPLLQLGVQCRQNRGVVVGHDRLRLQLHLLPAVGHSLVAGLEQRPQFHLVELRLSLQHAEGYEGIAVVAAVEGSRLQEPVSRVLQLHHFGTCRRVVGADADALVGATVARGTAEQVLGIGLDGNVSSQCSSGIGTHVGIGLQITAATEAAHRHHLEVGLAEGRARTINPSKGI